MDRRLTSIILSAIVAAGGMTVAPCASRGDDATRERGILAREPVTPIEHLDAAIKMLQLSRPTLAKQYLEALIGMNPDDATLLAMREKFGTATLLSLSRLENMQPEGMELFKLANGATQRQLNDPAFANGVLKGLHGSAREREAAMETLRFLGPNSVAMILKDLGTNSSPEETLNLNLALLQLGEMVVAPLEAALESPDSNVQVTAATTLGRLDSERSVLSLLATAFKQGQPPAVVTAVKQAIARIEFEDVNQAVKVTSFRCTEKLIAAALPHFAHTAQWTPDADGLVSIWSWNPNERTVTEHRVSEISASLFVGEQWCRRALAVTPESPVASAMLLGLLMARDVHAVGWDQPIPEGPGTAYNLGLSMGQPTVIQTLKLALEHDNEAAALMSLKVLGQIGTRASLLYGNESPPLLVQALRSPKPRVQFLSAVTILHLDPDKPFPGAPSVVDVLARALHAAPQPKVVVIDPNTSRGSRMAGLLANVGYQSELARTGQDGFRIASRGGDVELAVVHITTMNWNLGQTVANLRADSRTAGVPIAVYGPAAFSGETEIRFKGDRLIGFLDETGETEIVSRQLAPILAMRPTPPLSDAQRAAQTVDAAYWLRFIAEGRRTDVFRIDSAEEALSISISNTEVARDALAALGVLPKPSVQKRLAEVALAPAYPDDVREYAAFQTGYHIQRFGRMLDNAQATEVEQAWRMETDPAMKTALGVVVGALGVNSTSAARELSTFPPSSVPLP